MLDEDPSEWDDLYDDIPADDSENLPIAHVMVTGKRGRPPSQKGESSQDIVPESYLENIQEGRRTKPSDSEKEQDVLALEHDDKEKDILIQKLQEQIGQMATAMATLTAQISCQPSPALPAPEMLQNDTRSVPQSAPVHSTHVQPAPTVIESPVMPASAPIAASAVALPVASLSLS